MDEILKILQELRELSGNIQLDYLEEHKSDLLRDVLDYTYDPNKKYKINEGKFDKIAIPYNFGEKHLTLEDWETYKKHLAKLIESKSAKDLEVAYLKSYMYSFSEIYYNFLKMVLFKDLRLNIGILKIQKVWNDFCVQLPYMGCRPFTQKNLNAVIFPAYAQTKMDGSFCNLIVDLENNKISYMSRQSKPQPVQGSLDKFLLEESPVRNLRDKVGNKFVFTGELLVWDNQNNKPLPRKLGNGILRREQKTHQELNSIHFTCWDIIPYDKFIQKEWNIPYIERWKILTDIMSNLDRFHLVNTWVVNNLKEAEQIFDEQYANGEEGIVVKEMTQIWKDGKPKGQVKMKAEKDCELRMISFQEGKGNYSGMCGNIQCISEDNLLEVFVKPRTPDDAKTLWNNQDFYRNKILTVTFNEVITSETKEKPSLYLPRFVEIRDDKDTADTFEMIKEL